MKTQRKFFYTNIKIMKLAGLWIPDQGETLLMKYFYYVYNMLLLSYSVVFGLPMEIWAFKYSYHKMEELMKNVSIGVTHFLGFIKIYVWFRHRHQILEIMDILEEKAAAYEPIGDFQPENIIEEKKETKELTTKLFFALGCAVSVTQMIASTWTLMTDYERYEEITILPDNTTTYRYTQAVPYYMVMPWNYDTSKKSYAIALILNCFLALHFAWIIVGTDTVFTALLSYTSAQLKILQGAFKTIRPRCLRALNMENVPVLHDSDILRAAMMKEMNNCIRHLQLIFRLCEKMENIYTYVTLSQVLCSQIILCACLYMVSAVPMTSKAFASELDLLVGVELQIAIYCFFGNELPLTASDVSSALFQGDWLSTSKSFKKSMLITMTRLRKPIYLTIGKFSPLTLVTFVAIGRASYSFFAVIKKKNSPT